MRVKRDNKELQGLKGVSEGLVRRGHKRIQEVTGGGGNSWLKGATSGYRVTTGNYRLVLFILELLSFILHFIYKTLCFLIFLFYWEQLLKINKTLIYQLWYYTRWWNNYQMKEFKVHGIA